MTEIQELLIGHEGLKLKPYRDTEGILTIGVGRNLEDNGISKDEALYMLNNDIETAISDLKSIFDDFELYPKKVQLVLIDMMFNLGKPRFSGFVHMIAAVKEQNWKNMIKEMKDSHWCEELTERCEHDISLIEEVLSAHC